MKRTSGILDVARAAGVSTATVSRVLTGSAFVSEGTKARVLDAVKALDFHPNNLAQGLRSGRSKTIGLLVGDIEQGIYPALTRYIQEALEEAGYELLLYNLGHRQQRLESILERVSVMKMRGVILAMSDPIDEARLTPLVTRIHDKGAFILSVGQSLQHLEIPSIVHDEQAAVESSIAYLVKKYGEIPAFLGRIGSSVLGRLRFDGYRSGLQRLGLALDPNLVWDTSRQLENGYRFRAGRKQVLEQIRRGTKFRAIQASSDELALGAMAAIMESGLRLPEDVAIVGVGDVEWSAHVTPALTTLGGHTKWVSEKLVELIRNQDEGEPMPACIVFSRPFLIRASA
jgi:DNA-binding LacI/PurR family transcriptional regulator